MTACTSLAVSFLFISSNNAEVRVLQVDLFWLAISAPDAQPSRSTAAALCQTEVAQSPLGSS